MIIVPNLSWRTFRYWAVRTSDVRDIGSSPEGEHWVIPLLTLTWKSRVTTLQTNCKPATIQLPAASSPHHPCNHDVMYLLMSVSSTKKSINQKEWHIATKRLIIPAQGEFVKWHHITGGDGNVANLFSQCKFFEGSLTRVDQCCGVVDPDPVGCKIFSRIRIRAALDTKWFLQNTALKNW